MAERIPGMRGYPIAPTQGRIVLSGNKALPYKVLVDGQEFSAATMRAAEVLMRDHAQPWRARAPARRPNAASHLRLVINND